MKTLCELLRPCFTPARRILSGPCCVEPLESRIVLTVNLVSGNLLTGAIWADGDIQRITGDTTLPAGATLTIQPGAIIQFDPDADLTIDGTLNAVGTAAKKILFTSIRDDSGRDGIPGNADDFDTGGDGGATSPAPGNWGHISFGSVSSPGTLAHWDVRYGGAGFNAGLITSHALTLTDSSIRNTAGVALQLQSVTAALTNTAFSNNTGAAILMDLASDPTFSGTNSFTNNAWNGVEVHGTSLSADTVWNDPSVVYRIADSLFIPANRTLTLGAGQILKLDSIITVSGSLVANGTAAAPVIFTNLRDDSAGGDSNNGGLPAGFDNATHSLSFTSSSTGSLLDHVEVRYFDGFRAAIELSDVPAGRLTIQDSLIRNSADAGLHLLGSSPTLTRVTFQDSAMAAVLADPASDPVITAPVLTNNAINGYLIEAGTLPTNTVWNNPDIVYVLSTSLLIPQAATLAISPGQIIKAEGGTGLTFLGAFDVNGTAEQPVILTSLKDDSAGGDTNNDGSATAAVRGGWAALLFNQGSTATIEHAEIRYGSANNTGQAGSIMLDHVGSFTMSDSLVRDSLGTGLRLDFSDPVLSGVSFRNNTNAALSTDLESKPAFPSVATISGNGINGLALDPGTLPAGVTTLWNDPGIVYWIRTFVTVPATATLTISPGQVVKSVDGGQILVNGALDAHGTAAQPIIFTSDSDNSVGGRTNTFASNPLNPSPGEWLGLRFTNANAASVMDHTEVRYGSGLSATAAAVEIVGANLTLTNSVVRDSAMANVRIENGTPVITGNVFTGSFGPALSMDLNSNPVLQNNVLFGNDADHVQLDGGQLQAGGTNWDDPDIVYQIRQQIFVPAGRTLTIAPGQIIKAESAAAGTLNPLTVNGTLTALGTVDQPIIFTSWHDDSAGGHTATRVPGTWGGLGFGPTSTGSVLDHVDIRFVTGSAITVIGAPLTLKNSVLPDVVGRGVLLANDANVTLTSNVISSRSPSSVNGVELQGGTLTAANNTIHGFATGLAGFTSGTVTLTNNLITGSRSFGVQYSGDGPFTAAFNDVFSLAGATNWSGIADPTGASGNVSVDPRYFSAESLQFRLQPRSPVIDAGTSTGAPLTDFFGATRFDHPSVNNTGGGTTPFFDMGAIEVVAVVSSNIDLATTSVTSATLAGIPGATANVSWTVKNLGAGPASGPWFDTIYLSVDPAFSADDLILGQQDHQAFLGSGLSYTESKNVTLPAVLPGNYYFIVRANASNDVFEASALANNSHASAGTIAMDLPALTLGTSLPGNFFTAGQVQFYKLTVAAGEDLSIALDGQPGATNELYVRYGDLPSRQLFDERGVRAGPDQSVSIADTPAGTYYVMAYAAALPGAQPFSVLAKHRFFSVSDVGPKQGSNLGQVTLAIAGAQFDLKSQPLLIDSAGAPIQPLKVYFSDSGLLSATFDLRNHPTGLADVQVVNSGNDIEELTNGFEVTSGAVGRLVTGISSPTQVRGNRDFTVYLEYTNAGETDILAPVILVASDGPSLLSAFPDRSESAAELNLIGLGPDFPAGVLPPGATARLPLYSHSSNNTVTDVFSTFTAAYPEVPIDWIGLGPRIRPDGLSDAAWNALLGRLQANIGDTWDDYARVISTDATLLPAGLGSNALLSDVFQLEISKATADLNTSISGRLFLRDTVHPAANVEISLYNSATKVAFTTFSLNDGTFLFPAVAAGTYQASYGGFISAGPSQITVGASDKDGVELVVKPGGVVSGNVLLAAGSVPLRDVVITATAADGRSFLATSDSVGRYSIDSLPTGVYELSAATPALGRVVLKGVNVTAGELSPQHNLLLGQGGSISGHVVGPGGPLANVAVVAIGDDGIALNATTDASGSYHFPGLPAQGYSLQALVGDLTDVHQSVVLPVMGSLQNIDLVMALGGSLAGDLTSVVDGSAAAFVGVNVTIAGTVFSTLSDGTGHFELHDLPPGAFSFTAAGEGFMSKTANGTIVAQTAGSLDLALAPRGTVSGVVSAAVGGQPLSHVVVFATDADGFVAQTVTDDLGAYTLDALDAGAYQVWLGDASTPGLVRASVTLSESVRSAAANLSLPIAGLLSGTVYDSDGTTPLAGASATLFEAEDAILSTRTDALGHYSFVIVASGTYAVQASDAGRIFPVHNGLSVSGGGAQAGVDFVAGHEVINGVVTDAATGDPVANAVVTIAHQGAGQLASSTTVFTAADGSFHLTKATAGSYRVVASAAGHAPAVQLTNVVSGTPASVAASLAVEKVLSGTVISAADGTPVALARIRVVSPTDPTFNLEAFADETGNYEVRGLPAGEITVIVSAPGKAAEVHPNVTIEAASEVLSFALDPSAAVVSGTAKNGSLPLAKVVVSALDAEGRVLGQTTTDAAGAFTLDFLPAGSYSVVASADGYRDATPVPIALSAGVPLTGVALTLTGAGISDPPNDPGPTSLPGLIRVEKFFHFFANRPEDLTNAPYKRLEDALAAHADSPCVEELELFRKFVSRTAFDYLEVFTGMLPSKSDAPTDNEGGRSSNALAEFVKNARTIENSGVELGTLTTVDVFSPSPSNLLPEHYDIGEIFNALRAVQSQIGAGNFEASLPQLDQLDAIVQRLAVVMGRLQTATSAGGAAGQGSNVTVMPRVFGDIVINAGVKGASLDFAGPRPDLGTGDKSYYHQALEAFAKIHVAIVDYRGTLAQVLRFEEAKRKFDGNLELADIYLARLIECERDHDKPEDKTDPIGRPNRPEPTPFPAPPPPPPPDAAPGTDPGPSTRTTTATGRDPNHKTGPAGFGAQGFIQPGTLEYEVEFENDPLKATAAVQIVTVTDLLDPDLDLSTLQFTSFGFGKFKFDVPAGLSHYQTMLDLRPDGIALLVPVVLDIDPDTRVLSATFSSLNPDTLLAPDGVDEGFLPVNNATHAGEGFFTYSIAANSGAASGTAITNFASIVFDDNAAILTPETLNTIDVTAPMSAISTASGTLAKSAINLTLTSQDAHSGVASLDVFVSDNGGAYAPAFLSVLGSTATYFGEPGHEYRFYSAAHDHVGNTEAAPLVPDTTITLVPAEQIVLNKQQPKLAFTDEDGTLVKVALSGEGTATIQRFKGANGQGDIFDIDITGSDAKSKLTITPSKGDTTVSGVDVLGPVNSLSMKGVQVSDHVNVTGAVSSLTLGNLVGGADINLGGTVPKGAKVIVGDASGESDLTSAGPLASLQAVRWTDGKITAPSLGTLTIAGSKKPLITGDFGADLKLTDVTPALTLNTAKIAGAIVGGAWDITGNTGKISALSTAASWTAAFTGNVTEITTTGNASGQITAKSINALTVGANLTGAAITLTQPVVPTDARLEALHALKITGILDNSTIKSAGHIGSVTAGALRNSSIFAGVKAATVGLPDALADFEVAARIATVTVKGIQGVANGVVNSNIAARVLGKVTLRDILNSNGGSDFGLAADEIAALTILQGGTVEKLTPGGTVPGGEAVRHGSFVARVF
ncbi:MAG: hypothetical protein QOE70_123 [Chthoniobacter sp.]|jgi:hypothetical protein|nr:hypothetical protein [Chthoniobacter sp.]